MIKDQRTMTGRRRLNTLDEVEAAWIRRARHPFEERDDAIGLVNLTAGPALPAYVNHGRWVAECPFCGGGIAGWPENPRGACLSCGRVYRLEYPMADVVAEVEALLEVRPRQNRNFQPHKGETTRTLEAENAVGGPAPDPVLAAFEQLVEDRIGNIGKAL